MHRILVVDPVCAQLQGHNLTSLKIFQKYLASLRPEATVSCVASRNLAPELANRDAIHAHFNFYYHNRMKLSDPSGRPIDAVDAFDEEDQEGLAIEDFKSLREEYDLDNGDAIFFPSVDFYGALGALQLLEAYAPADAPSLYLRFIGVMEYASSAYADPQRELLRRVRRAMSKGYRVKIAAEASPYAAKLSRLLKTVVAVTPVPSNQSLVPLPEDGPFTVISPGSGRADKGFNLLPQIISILRQRYPALYIRFIAQNLPSWELKHHLNAASQLYAMPGVSLRNSSIDFSEMDEIFRSSHVVLMPYSEHIYALRSSAILTESAGYGRLVVTSTGTGFENDVRYFCMGRVCRTPEEYAEAIADYAQMPRRDLEQLSAQASRRYSIMCAAEYEDWFR